MDSFCHSDSANELVNFFLLWGQNIWRSLSNKQQSHLAGNKWAIENIVLSRILNFKEMYGWSDLCETTGNQSVFPSKSHPSLCSEKLIGALLLPTYFWMEREREQTKVASLWYSSHFLYFSPLNQTVQLPSHPFSWDCDMVRNLILWRDNNFALETRSFTQYVGYQDSYFHISSWPRN